MVRSPGDGPGLRRAFDCFSDIASGHEVSISTVESAITTWTDCAERIDANDPALWSGVDGFTTRGCDAAL